jgi:hypothetical protein
MPPTMFLLEIRIPDEPIRKIRKAQARATGETIPKGWKARRGGFAARTSRSLPVRADPP